MVNNPPINAEDVGSIPGSGRSPAGKEMATHSSIVAGEIPCIKEFDRLLSLDLQRRWT